MTRILSTERLYFREFTLKDIELLIDLNSDPEVTKYVGEGAIEKTEAVRLLNEVIIPQYSNKMGRWAVYLRSNNEFIGWCGIKHLPSLNEYDLGYRFFKKHWGKGYATEASKAVVEYGRNILKLKEIVGRASVDNHNSIKVLEKAGLKFIEEGFEHGEKIKKFKSAFLPGIG
ncbi:MAG: GCN5-related N-acetyltransferase [Bacteroidetes bacterium]|jgi:RimJ/RimL family protein N-acetyltransferase|nr:GCN5-related N-acetyltransferase [Bacteroidota bacterium]